MSTTAKTTSKQTQGPAEVPEAGRRLPGSVTVTEASAIGAILAAAGLPTDELPTTVTVQLPKAGRPAPVCECGCGERTGGGRFRPGHDAKLKSALLARSRDGDKAATDELIARAWPLPKPKKETAPAAE